MGSFASDALECLAAIIEEGGFDRAATGLSITQSTESQRLRSLEMQTGTAPGGHGVQRRDGAIQRPQTPVHPARCLQTTRAQVEMPGAGNAIAAMRSAVASPCMTPLSERRDAR